MADPKPVAMGVTRQPTPAEQQQILGLIRRAAEVDGHQAVNEAGRLALRHTDQIDADDAVDADDGKGSSDSRAPIHLLARDPGTDTVIGYGQAIWEDDGPVAALVVDPDRRRHGVGAALWRRLATVTAEPLRIWASGDGPAARALAAQQGLRPVRRLVIMGRSLDGELPPTTPPAGITIRTFRRGRDEDGWVAVNARAFAAHPEQGSMTRADLEQRMAEPWFDPVGLFLGVREDGGGIVGFHWTKQEPDSSTGEVYVIGVDPTAGVRGLGGPLLGVGLRHLRDRGADAVELYVESDNARALALYHRYGFAEVSADVMYAAPMA